MNLPPSRVRIRNDQPPRRRRALPATGGVAARPPAVTASADGHWDVAPEVVFDSRDVSVFYGRKQALAGVNLAIRRGQITALIGPSGCGKTTFLRSLNRMNDSVPSFRIEGEILYHGHDIYGGNVDQVEVRRRIGMVFQKPNPFPKSIYDNVAWAPRNLGMRSGLAERVEKALRGAALWDEVKDRLKDSALGLSGGQQQRLCIARAIAIEPDVLLLDEPASALDPIATGAIEDLMHSLKGRFTIVIVTHNMQQAARVADRTAFFSLETGGAKPVGVADRVRRHRAHLRLPPRPPHPRLRHRPLRLAARLARAGSRRRRPARAAACRTASRRWRRSSGGRRSDLQEPEAPVSSVRTIRSTSLSSASASCSSTARLTRSSTLMLLRIAIS